jgi:hypothetical protein
MNIFDLTVTCRAYQQQSAAAAGTQASAYAASYSTQPWLAAATSAAPVSAAAGALPTNSGSAITASSTQWGAGVTATPYSVVAAAPQGPFSSAVYGSQMSAAQPAPAAAYASYAAAVAQKPALSVQQAEASKRPNPSRFAAAPAVAVAVVPQASVAAKSQLAPQQTAVPSTQWPASLKKFVSRAFSLCSNDVDRGRVTDMLRKLMTKVSAENRLLTHDWDSEPVPDPRATPAAATGVEIKAEGETKKRKSRFNVPPSDVQQAAAVPVVPAAAAPAKKQKTSANNMGTVEVDSASLKKRAQRFETQKSGGGSSKSSQKPTLGWDKDGGISYSGGFDGSNQADAGSATEFDVTKNIVVGTCRKIEKDYFRLTSAPDPATVRPESVLKLALAQIKDKWASKTSEYLYICSQLKAIRQDVLVQHIQNGNA